MVIVIEKACVLVDALLSLELGVCHSYGMVWGGLVFYLVYTLSYLHRIASH
jgi:hypothetical protein